jgi:hypothetical protein
MISYRMVTKRTDTDQLNIRLQTKRIVRLEELAEKYKFDRKRRNEVAVDIIDTFIEWWAKLEEARMKELERQRALLMGQSPTTGMETPRPAQVPRKREIRGAINDNHAKEEENKKPEGKQRKIV